MAHISTNGNSFFCSFIIDSLTLSLLRSQDHLRINISQAFINVYPFMIIASSFFMVMVLSLYLYHSAVNFSNLIGQGVSKLKQDQYRKNTCIKNV